MTMDSFLSYILTLFRKAPTPRPKRRARGKAAPASERDPRAVALKEMLEALYKSQHPFRLSVQDRKPKTRAGIYSPRFARITVYAGHGHIEEIAIHEYAHHIVLTELNRAGAVRNHHARGFKTVYSKLIDAYNATRSPLQPDARYYLPRGKRMRIFDL